ncbi:hypothetical protein C0V70_13385 [Bacteriovorax stolpii]|uniref:Uncharacterized protein n=1 Tax=Bacteriovorax stolpii TaxID=960 RepID=A0A2K9NVI5_BACTC|nr:glycosyltransferase family 2 protein [Bacteriovorax stolpii]AUN99075.1 hypothetical protein C0V70_13385 [Bacteriovorax stolpii]TDP55395.1 glycosyltransferase involved in cell wall biosynthesis [Bacteriovorax stolpii]BDT29242.1 glycosyltransferase family 2 protein [Bacteriovorax sp. HI3]
MTNDLSIPASVLIIAQNAEKHLRRCLDSLKAFKEVVIIDGGSKDKTEEIAKTYPNVKFVKNPWPGFIPQRNVSIDNASYEWCFMIDSDEAATPELVEEIRKVVEKNDRTIAMWRVVRTEYFEGAAIEYGHGRSDYQERLFLRDRTRYTGGNHHLHLIDGIDLGKQPHLMADFPRHVRVLHDPDYDLDAMITKMPRFSMLIGSEKFNKGRRVSAPEVIFSFVWTAIRMSWRSRKMGKRGIVLAFMKAYSDSLAKLYIYDLQNFRNIKQSEADKKYVG